MRHISYQSFVTWYNGANQNKQMNSTIKSSYFPLLWIIGLGVLLSSYARLYFGVDYSDEPFCLATAMRFLLGDRPFVDDISQTQGAALYLVPFLALFRRISDSIDGIVLWTRHVYWVLSLGLSFLIYFSFKSLTTRLSAFLLALTTLAFTPVIPTISHNTLVFIFFTAGFCFDRLGLRILSGACHAIAGISFPPIIPAIFLFGVTRPRHLLGLVATFLITSLAYKIAPGSVISSFTQFLTNSESHASFLSLERAQELGALLGSRVMRPGFLVLLSTWALVILLPPLRALTKWLLYLTIPALIWINRTSTGGMDAFGAFIQIPFLGFCFTAAHPSSIRPLLPMFLSSCLAAFLFSMCGGGNIRGATFALLPAVIASWIWMENWMRTQKVKGVAVAQVLFLVMLTYGSRGVFRNGLPALHKEVSPRGPYKGIFTRPERNTYLADLSNSMANLGVGNSEKILVYPHFTAGYLLGERKPVAKHLWDLCLSSAPRQCVHALQSIEEPFLWIRPKQNLFDYDQVTWVDARIEDASVLNWFKSSCRVIQSNSYYELARCNEVAEGS